ncbi:hypothetical protein B566_EDAN014371 [Ephemera danica]|nr:hypothetical protein B566_EDAN014371 [Ephemera danica]
MRSSNFGRHLQPGEGAVPQQRRQEQEKPSLSIQCVPDSRPEYARRHLLLFIGSPFIRPPRGSMGGGFRERKSDAVLGKNLGLTVPPACSEMGPLQQPSSLPPGAGVAMTSRSSVEEAVLLGRRSVVGSVNATSLAALVRSLRAGSLTALRRGLHTYWLKCTDQGLELRGPRYDEGFESDDTESTRSGGEAEERAGESSSGVSDVDEFASDSSLQGLRLPPLRELYSVRDVVFCHGDPTFPRTLVWVVNTSKRPSPGFLEALVFECKTEASVRQLCMNYQEISRRYKLEQYSVNKRKESTTLGRPRYNPHSEYESKSSFTREMECVTGFEPAETGPVLGRRRERVMRQREPPSLLILPPVQKPDELHKKWSPPPTEEEPPKRPERRRYIRKNKNSAQDDANIMRGQFVRVTVESNHSPALLKPQFTWMYGVPATAEMVLSQPAQPQVRSRRSCRSVSPTMSRRRPPPMPHRYGVEAHQLANTTHRLVQGLSQKLRELTPVGGTLKHPKKYTTINDTQQQYTTLKPVIKKANKSRYGDVHGDQPKKVTFSAYATVQVVD